MSAFQIGEKICFLDEAGYGVIKEFLPNKQVLVEDESGFDITYPLDVLVKIQSSEYEIENVNYSVSADKIKADKAPIYEREELIYGNSKSSKYWEIDLHIEALTESHKGLTNSEILKIQMTEFRSFFRKACKYHISKLIAIHGVGEGVLKQEIRQFLDGKENLEYFDASYREYGKGATEIRVPQSLFEKSL